MSSTLTQSPYVNRFENMLEPLQLRLVKLENDLNSIKDDHPYKQQSRRDILEEINKIKKNMESAEKNLEYSKKMEIIRSDKIPSNIADHNVWNDCWYDEERKLFVTHCKYFKELSDSRERPHQIQYEKETNDDGIVALADKVEFRFGYPCVIQKDKEGNPVWYLLPTLTDNILTEEIVTTRLKPKSHEESILYRTESEQWITIGTQGLRLCEKENEISDKLELYPKVPLEELKTLYDKK
ncbi:hypothetical protein [Nitrosopumilus sp.]|uniref:hypothetical protein n=1 Tax=Nitrosopumilus sp. TaxID=2024843 RepID=UPI00292D740A|nr:hypothetical protein [Nitrosopumilus sp.]